MIVNLDTEFKKSQYDSLAVVDKTQLMAGLKLIYGTTDAVVKYINDNHMSLTADLELLELLHAVVNTLGSSSNLIENSMTATILRAAYKNLNIKEQ